MSLIASEVSANELCTLAVLTQVFVHEHRCFDTPSIHWGTAGCHLLNGVCIRVEVEGLVRRRATTTEGHDRFLVTNITGTASPQRNAAANL